MEVQQNFQQSRLRSFEGIAYFINKERLLKASLTDQLKLKQLEKAVNRIVSDDKQFFDSELTFLPHEYCWDIIKQNIALVLNERDEIRLSIESFIDATNHFYAHTKTSVLKKHYVELDAFSKKAAEYIEYHTELYTDVVKLYQTNKFFYITPIIEKNFAKGYEQLCLSIEKNLNILLSWWTKNASEDVRIVTSFLPKVAESFCNETEGVCDLTVVATYKKLLQKITEIKKMLHQPECNFEEIAFFLSQLHESSVSITVQTFNYFMALQRYSCFSFCKANLQYDFKKEIKKSIKAYAYFDKKDLFAKTLVKKFYKNDSLNYSYKFIVVHDALLKRLYRESYTSSKDIFEKKQKMIAKIENNLLPQNVFNSFSSVFKQLVLKRFLTYDYHFDAQNIVKTVINEQMYDFFSILTMVSTGFYGIKENIIQQYNAQFLKHYTGEHFFNTKQKIDFSDFIKYDFHKNFMRRILHYEQLLSWMRKSNISYDLIEDVNESYSCFALVKHKITTYIFPALRQKYKGLLLWKRKESFIKGLEKEWIDQRESYMFNFESLLERLDHLMNHVSHFDIKKMFPEIYDWVLLTGLLSKNEMGNIYLKDFSKETIEHALRAKIKEKLISVYTNHPFELSIKPDTVEAIKNIITDEIDWHDLQSMFDGYYRYYISLWKDYSPYVHYALDTGVITEAEVITEQFSSLEKLVQFVIDHVRHKDEYSAKELCAHNFSLDEFKILCTNKSNVEYIVYQDNALPVVTTWSGNTFYQWFIALIDLIKKAIKR